MHLLLNNIISPGGGGGGFSGRIEVVEGKVGKGIDTVASGFIPFYLSTSFFLSISLSLSFSPSLFICFCNMSHFLTSNKIQTFGDLSLLDLYPVELPINKLYFH